MHRADPTASQAAEQTSLASATSLSLYDKCLALAHNLWWSWQPEVVNLLRDLGSSLSPFNAQQLAQAVQRSLDNHDASDNGR